VCGSSTFQNQTHRSGVADGPACNNDLDENTTFFLLSTKSVDEAREKGWLLI